MTEMISDSQLPPSPQTPKSLPEQVEKFFQACNKCEDLSTPKSTFLTHKAIFAATVLENSINYRPPDRNITLLASVHELHLVSHEKLANEYEVNITKIRKDAQKAVELLVGLIRDVVGSVGRNWRYTRLSFLMIMLLGIAKCRGNWRILRRYISGF